MARLVIQFPGFQKLVINGELQGETNQVISLTAGVHTIKLDAVNTEPAQHVINIPATADANEIIVRSFRPVKEAVHKFSPLYYTYNGFILGQFIALLFVKYGRHKYAEWRFRIQQFLQEIGIELSLPEIPGDLGDETHVELITAVLKTTQQQSAELADFVLLGASLVHYGLLDESDTITLQEIANQIEYNRNKYQLPPLDLVSFRVKEAGNVDQVLSPSLLYLTKMVDQLEPENDTAFVIMPFKQPYASYYATFYRLSLEDAGYRAFRAWGGLSNEDYCEMLLKLISKVGFVWADVSELNYNVLYEIGAAHAMEKPSLLIVRNEDAATIPANIGHDVIIGYSPAEKGWQETILLMATCISVLKSAIERGNRLRMGPKVLEESYKRISAMLEAVIFPPEAYEAQEKGRQYFAEKKYAEAERCLTDAIQFGINDTMTMLARGTVRIYLDKYADAEADLTELLEAREANADEQELLSLAAFFRGVARESMDKYAAALNDYTTAIKLGYPEAEVFERRASVHEQLGNTEAAQEDFTKAKEIASAAVSEHDPGT